MVARYKFLFVRHFKNNHGQITIPRGTAGILSFDDCKVHLQCFRIIPQQGTSHMTVKFDYIKNCVILKEITSRNEEKDNEGKRERVRHVPDSDAGDNRNAVDVSTLHSVNNTTQVSR